MNDIVVKFPEDKIIRILPPDPVQKKLDEAKKDMAEGEIQEAMENLASFFSLGLNYKITIEKDMLHVEEAIRNMVYKYRKI